MSLDTGWHILTNASGGSGGPPDWINLSNAQVLDNTFTEQPLGGLNAPAETEGEKLILSDPDITLPVGAVVDTLELAIRAGGSGSSNAFRLDDLVITDGNILDPSIIVPAEKTVVVTGNLAFWGLTNAQAIAFLAGDSGKTMTITPIKRTAEVNAGNVLYVYHVQAKAIYTPPQTSVVGVPALF